MPSAPPPPPKLLHPRSTLSSSSSSSSHERGGGCAAIAISGGGGRKNLFSRPTGGGVRGRGNDGRKTFEQLVGGRASVVFSPPSLDRLLLFGGGMAFCFLLLPASCVYVNLSYPFVPNIISFRRARGGERAGKIRARLMFIVMQITARLHGSWRRYTETFFSPPRSVFTTSGRTGLPSTRKGPNTNSKQGKRKDASEKASSSLP